MKFFPTLYYWYTNYNSPNKDKVWIVFETNKSVWIGMIEMFVSIYALLALIFLSMWFITFAIRKVESIVTGNDNNDLME